MPSIPFRSGSAKHPHTSATQQAGTLVSTEVRKPAANCARIPIWSRDSPPLRGSYGSLLAW